MVGTFNLGYSPVEGTRLSLFLRAQRSVFGFDALGSPTFDNANSTGHDNSLLGRIGVTSKLFDGSYETSAFFGRLQQDRHYTQALNALDPNLATNDSRYHAYRTDLQWNNTVHLGDLFDVPMLSATDLTFGYEYTADTANVRVNSSSGGFGSSRTPRRHEHQCSLCRTADHAVAAADVDGSGPPGLGRRQHAVHLASGRGVGRAGTRHSVQGCLRHCIPCAIVVRPLSGSIRSAMSAIRT